MAITLAGRFLRWPVGSQELSELAIRRANRNLTRNEWDYVFGRDVSYIHLHAFVHGGGPSLVERDTWKNCKPPPRINQQRLWLVDADELRVAFRIEYLKGLRSLHARSKLMLVGDWEFLRDVSTFEAWLKPLEQQSWVTFIQSPPENSSPEHVLRYLARYMTGGPISDRRLVSSEDGMVKFSARNGTEKGGNDETEEVPMSGVEFVRRWSLHILPKGFTKTRRFGGFSNYHRKRYMAECAARQNHLVAEQTAESQSNDAADGITQYRCPHCESPLLQVAKSDAPSWRDVMRSEFRPAWYDDG